jgi:hypothetical protein
MVRGPPEQWAWGLQRHGSLVHGPPSAYFDPIRRSDYSYEEPADFDIDAIIEVSNPQFHLPSLYNQGYSNIAGFTQQLSSSAGFGESGFAL